MLENYEKHIMHPTWSESVYQDFGMGLILLFVYQSTEGGGYS